MVLEHSERIGNAVRAQRSPQPSLMVNSVSLSSVDFFARSRRTSASERSVHGNVREHRERMSNDEIAKKDRCYSSSVARGWKSKYTRFSLSMLIWV